MTEITLETAARAVLDKAHHPIVREPGDTPSRYASYYVVEPGSIGALRTALAAHEKERAGTMNAINEAITSEIIQYIAVTGCDCKINSTTQCALCGFQEYLSEDSTLASRLAGAGVTAAPPVDREAIKRAIAKARWESTKGIIMGDIPGESSSFDYHCTDSLLALFGAQGTGIEETCVWTAWTNPTITGDYLWVAGCCGPKSGLRKYGGFCPSCGKRIVEADHE